MRFNFKFILGTMVLSMLLLAGPALAAGPTAAVGQTVPGTDLPAFTPDQLTQIGLAQCYPFCFPFQRPITGIVTPSGGRGVKLPGPVTPFTFKLVYKAGLPNIEMSGNGIRNVFYPVPPEFLAAPVIAVPAPAPVGPVAPINGSGKGK